MPRPSSSPPEPPPLSSFPFTAGNFDFPHASASSSPSPSPSTASYSRDGASIRSALRSFTHRPEETSSPPTSIHYDGDMPRHTLDSARRARMRRLFESPRDIEAEDNLLRRPPTANPNRPRATPSERYLRRSQARIRQERAEMESAADLLDSLSDIPISMSDVPVNPFITSNGTTIRSRSPPVPLGSDRRQSKRRKLDHKATATSEYDGFKYGYKGQVVPGRLKMEIVSCDGGEYYEKDSPALYKVHNVLKNDKSVYCSQSPRCNLLLKHIGDTPFTLDRVVIRAPDRGFTAPVQEGLVFVSMSADDLLSSTAAYNLQYTPCSPFTAPSASIRDGEEQLTLQEAMEDPHIWQHSRHGAQDEIHERIRDLRLRTARANRESSLRSAHDRQPSQRRLLFDFEDDDGQDENEAYDVYGEVCDHTTDDLYTNIARVSAPTPPPFTVTTASDEEESESNEDLPSPAVTADRLRRESRWRPLDEDHDRLGRLRRAPALGLGAYSDWRERRERHVEPLRASQLHAPSRIEPASMSAEESATVLPPHARFFIAKNKSKITIKFHPAISGRNVLLKLWSPTHDGNIDIESVQFYGYSGPRFFPSTQPC